MSWKRAFLTQLLLPVAGGVSLGFGVYSIAAVPSEARIDEAHADVELMRQELDALRRQPVIEVSRFAAQLPEALEVSLVLKQIHEFAERCDIASIRFDLGAESGVAEPGDPGMEEVAPAPIPGGAPDTPVEAVAVREASTMACKFEIESSFESLVRFAGLVERMNPIATIATLDIQPGKQLMESKMVVHFHYLPPEGN